MAHLRANIAVALTGTGLASVGQAQGGPPMLTDDPGTPGNRHWEINIAAVTRHGDSGSETELPLLDLNYGLGERIQLKYEVPWTWVDDSGGGERSALGNSTVGIKFRFHDADPSGWNVSTYPQVEFRTPGSDAAREGIVEEGTAVFVPFQFQRSFEAFSVNFEVGREFQSRDPDEWAAGAVLGHEVTERLELMAELRATSDNSLDRSAVSANFGTRWAVSSYGTLLLSVGRDLHNALEDRAKVFGFVGWQVIR